jgi:predicted RNase H-like nuclease (RuvC/YqgF family)
VTQHQKTIEQLEAKLQRKNEVVSELMEAHLQLKKERGELLPARGFPSNNAIKLSNSSRTGPKEPSSPLRK